MDDTRKILEDLKSKLLQHRKAIEHAEAKCDEINPTIQELGRLMPSELFLGRAVSRPYDLEAHCQDSGLRIQAALKIPDGLGVCRLDTEHYAAIHEMDIENELARHFVPFDRCEPFEKAFLSSEIDALFQRFDDWVSKWAAWRPVNAFQEQLAASGRTFTDSTDSIREDRDR